MKYFTKEWQKKVSEEPENARALADQAFAGYRAEQRKNPVPAEFEKKLEFHDATILSSVSEGEDLHLFFDHSGFNPFDYNHIVFKKARIKKKEHDLSTRQKSQGCKHRDSLQPCILDF